MYIYIINMYIETERQSERERETETERGARKRGRERWELRELREGSQLPRYFVNLRNSYDFCRLRIVVVTLIVYCSGKLGFITPPTR